METSSFEVSEQLGYLWPVAIYQKVKGQPPPRKAVCTVAHHGKMVRGIILDESHGTPIGVLKIESKSAVAAVSSSVGSELRSSSLPKSEERCTRTMFTHMILDCLFSCGRNPTCEVRSCFPKIVFRDASTRLIA